MATTYPERTYTPIPVHAMRVVNDPHHNTAEALEAGELLHQVPLRNAVKGRKLSLLVYLLVPFSWLFQKVFENKSPYAGDYADGYKRFVYDKGKLIQLLTTFEDYPEGWARTAAYRISDPNFTNVRGYSYIHMRVIQKIENELQHLEDELKRLDEADMVVNTEESKQRLKGSTYGQRTNSAQDEVLEKIRVKISEYADQCEKFSKMRALGPTPRNDHMSLFRWIWWAKPAIEGEYEWIFHPEDFISLNPSKQNWFEDLILYISMSRLGTSLKKFIQTDREKNKTEDIATQYINNERLNSLAKITVVFSAVLILYIPVMLFMMTSMNRNSMTGVVLIPVFMFSVMMSVQKNIEIHDIFIGTATYCAVLITVLSDIPEPSASNMN